MAGRLVSCSSLLSWPAVAAAADIAVTHPIPICLPHNPHLPANLCPTRPLAHPPSQPVAHLTFVFQVRLTLFQGITSSSCSTSSRMQRSASRWRGSTTCRCTTRLPGPRTLSPLRPGRPAPARGVASRLSRPRASRGVLRRSAGRLNSPPPESWDCDREGRGKRHELASWRQAEQAITCLVSAHTDTHILVPSTGPISRPVRCQPAAEARPGSPATGAQRCRPPRAAGWSAPLS